MAEFGVYVAVVLQKHCQDSRKNLDLHGHNRETFAVNTNKVLLGVLHARHQPISGNLGMSDIVVVHVSTVVNVKKKISIVPTRNLVVKNNHIHVPVVRDRCWKELGVCQHVGHVANVKNTQVLRFFARD